MSTYGASRPDQTLDIASSMGWGQAGTTVRLSIIVVRDRFPLDFDRSAVYSADCAYASPMFPASGRELWRAAGAMPIWRSSVPQCSHLGAVLARCDDPPPVRIAAARDAVNERIPCMSGGQSGARGRFRSIDRTAGRAAQNILRAARLWRVDEPSRKTRIYCRAILFSFDGTKKFFASFPCLARSDLSEPLSAGSPPFHASMSAAPA
jgi:hypothetical protein